MKIFVFLISVTFIGTTSAFFSVPSGINGTGGNGLLGRLTNSPLFNISNLDGIRNLFRRSGDSILQAAAASFVAKFSDSPFFQGQSFAETAKNFIINAKKILSQPIDPNWKPGLDIELLGISEEDYKNLLGAIPPNERVSRGVNLTSSNRVKRQTVTVPDSIDWRRRGAVTGIKRQGKCASCWAFSAIGALEGRFAIKHKQLPVLSEQNLMDCAKHINGTKCCDGCNGGWMSDAYSFLELNNGVNSDAFYPYEARNWYCRQWPERYGATIGYQYTEENDEEDLKRAVAQGPVAAGVDSDGWRSYKSGIYRCRTLFNRWKPLNINHGVVIVGYGTSPTQGDYWIVKNSWGSSWGENGYIRIARNDNNQCGIAGSAMYPVL